MLCAKLILTQLSQWPCEVSFVFYSWGDMTQAVMLCWMIPSGFLQTNPPICNTWDSVVLHPSLAKWSTKGFVDPCSWCEFWLHSELCDFWYLSEHLWTSLWNEGHSIYMSNYKGGLNESVWLSEVSKVKLLPSSLAPTCSPFPLPSPPGSLGLLSYALSISCASPETGLHSLFICKPFMWPVLSFLPTSVLAPPTSLGWGAPTFTVFAEQPMETQSWGFEQLLSPAQDNHLPEFKKQPCNSITDRSQGRSCVLSTSVMPAPCDLRDCGSSAPLSMGFPRKEHWSGLPFLPLGELPDPGIEPESSALAGAFFTTVSPGKQRSSLDSNYI